MTNLSDIIYGWDTYVDTDIENVIGLIVYNDTKPASKNFRQSYILVTYLDYKGELVTKLYEQWRNLKYYDPTYKGVDKALKMYRDPKYAKNVLYKYYVELIWYDGSVSYDWNEPETMVVNY